MEVHDSAGRVAPRPHDNMLTLTEARGFANPVGRVALDAPQSHDNDTLRCAGIADGDGTPSLPPHRTIRVNSRAPHPVGRVAPRPPDNMLTLTEARGFAFACHDYGSSHFDSFYRGAFKKAAEVINSLCDELDALKEQEEGKERTSPHTPYREKGKEKKKAATATARARAREEEFCPPAREAVVEFAKAKNIPEEFVDYWFDCMDNNYSPPWFDAVTQKYITAWRRSLLSYWNSSSRDKNWFAFRDERRNKERFASVRKYSEGPSAIAVKRCA